MNNTIDNYYSSSPYLKEKHDQTKNLYENMSSPSLKEKNNQPENLYESVDEILNEKGQKKTNQHIPNNIPIKCNEESENSSNFKKYFYRNYKIIIVGIAVVALLASLGLGILIGLFVGMCPTCPVCPIPIQITTSSLPTVTPTTTPLTISTSMYQTKNTQKRRQSNILSFFDRCNNLLFQNQNTGIA